MTMISTYQLKQKSGIVRRSMRARIELGITYHDRPIGVVVPYEQRLQERAELIHLRAEVEALRAQCEQVHGSSAA